MFEAMARPKRILSQPPLPAQPLLIPPPSRLQSAPAPAPVDDVMVDDGSLDLAPLPPTPPTYFGFRSRHTKSASWTLAPGRWPSIAQAAHYATAAQKADKRLEVQIFPVG